MKSLLILILLTTWFACNKGEDQKPTEQIKDVVTTPTVPPVTGENPSDHKLWKPVPAPFQILESDSFSDAFKAIKPETKVVTFEWFDLNAEKIKQLHNKGLKVICYTSLTYEDWRPDAERYPKEAIGKPLDSWQGEKWADFSKPSVIAFHEKRIDDMAMAGCDGWEPDNQDPALNKKTGLSITKEENINALIHYFVYAKSKGMAVFQKNAGPFTTYLVDYADGVYIEECFEFDECDDYKAYVSKGKVANDLEYSKTPKVLPGFMNQRKSGYFKHSFTPYYSL